jgi:hypothetical protein
MLNSQFFVLPPTKSRYFPRNIGLFSWPGETVYEFLIVWTHEFHSLGTITDVFSKHKAKILMTHSELDGDTNTVVGTCYCDLAQADQTAEGIRKEIKGLGFVRSADFVGTKESPVDKFYFPILIFGGLRVLIMRVDALANMEKRLGEELGSAGGAIIFREGESYAAETMRNFKMVMENPTSESLLQSVKDVLRATGWGLFEFKVSKDDYLVTVDCAPQLEATTEPSRFLCGIIAGIVESVFSIKVRVVESKLDPEEGSLFVRLSKIP